MKLKLIALSLLVITSCNTCKKVPQDGVEEGILDATFEVYEIDSMVKSLKHQIDSLKIEIDDLKDQNNIVVDLLRVKEGEISYWGHKYQSLSDSINKVKPKK